jgi:hypothetical protein
MPSSIPQHKAKVNLADYSYQRDIENRMVMAHLSVFEVNILQEIIHHSLTISIQQLAKELDTTVDRLIPILDKLGATKLFKRQGMNLLVDKEMRKYFEFQLKKFDENFQPDLDFLQNVLSKVPIHVLPIWYAIPRMSDNIFTSIIEKYFLTPKIYRNYLNELQFDNPLLKAIIQDVYQTRNFKITATEIMAKHDLTREGFEECLLLLEYHFACCLSYHRVDDEWQEVVTPFAEWLEYLQFEAQTKPQPISGTIESGYYKEFNFIHDLVTLLKACQDKKIFPKDVENLRAATSLQLETAVKKLIQLKYAKQYANGQLMVTEKGKVWLSKPLPTQVSNLAADRLNTAFNVEEFSELWNVRNLHVIEKNLKRLVPNEWIAWDQFMEGFIAPIGDQEPITLKNRGKKWKYVLPIYTDQEKRFIQTVVMERLAELGVVSTGLHQSKPCFCLTSFGHSFVH